MTPREADSYSSKNGEIPSIKLQPAITPVQ